MNEQKGLDAARIRESLKSAEWLYRAVGESINYGIWVCDADGRNLYASESFLKLVGLTQEECSGFGWGNVLHPDDAERTIKAWQECVATGGSWDIEHRFRGVDGKYHAVLARGTAVRDSDGRVLCWAGINLDISRLKSAEEELREVDRRKDEFLATLAHELRNPLAPIRNAAHVIRLKAISDPQLQRAQEIIDRQSPTWSGRWMISSISRASRRQDCVAAGTRAIANGSRIRRRNRPTTDRGATA